MNSAVLIGIAAATQCTIWGLLGWTVWSRWRHRRAVRSASAAAQAGHLGVVDISRLAAHERWSELLAKGTGYLVLAPFVIALVCWAYGNWIGLGIALGASVPVLWAVGALSRQCSALGWAIVGLWCGACLTFSILGLISEKTWTGRLSNVVAAHFSMTVFFAPLLIWAWRVLFLWYGHDAGSVAFRAVRARVDTAENRRALKERERRRWSSDKNRGEVIVLSGAAAAQSLLGFASLFTGTNVVQIALRQTAEATRGRARQLSAASGSALLEGEKGGPILYLRSFADDGLYFSTWGGRVAWEKPIVDAGLLVGPVIAIGRPGEGLPQLGAARDYLSDDEWQNHAQEWMAVAHAIILVVGPTAGLAWEATELHSRQLLHKTILLMPPVSDAEMQQRWNTFLENLDRNGPYGELAKLDPRYTLAVYFDSAGRPTAIFSTRRNRPTDYHWAVKVALALIELSTSAADESARSGGVSATAG